MAFRCWKKAWPLPVPNLQPVPPETHLTLNGTGLKTCWETCSLSILPSGSAFSWMACFSEEGSIKAAQGHKVFPGTVGQDLHPEPIPPPSQGEGRQYSSRHRAPPCSQRWAEARLSQNISPQVRSSAGGPMAGKGRAVFPETRPTEAGWNGDPDSVWGGPSEPGRGQWGLVVLVHYWMQQPPIWRKSVESLSFPFWICSQPWGSQNRIKSDVGITSQKLLFR